VERGGQGWDWGALILFAAIFFADKDGFEYPKQKSADGG
jgi:hypothetical protein